MSVEDPRGPWSDYFAPTEPAPAPADPEQAAPVDEDDPEEGHPT